MAFSCAALALPRSRASILSTAGELLVVNDALTPSDVIVAMPDSGAAGLLEAADLANRGLAPRVAVFSTRPDPADVEFARRGVRVEDPVERWARDLRALGVAVVERIPGAVGGTSNEVDALPAWCDARGFHSVIVVGTADHTRRLRRTLGRAVRGHAITVAVRAARFSVFDPERWWTTRDGARIGIVETEKLLLDVVRHPGW